MDDALNKSLPRGLAIIGHVDHGRTTLTAALKSVTENNDVTIVALKKPADVIIDGVGYYRKQESQRSGGHSRMSVMLMGAAIMFGGQGSIGSSKTSTDILAGINIVEEFKLIQQKKSNQSKRVRDAVVRCFYQNFECAD